MIYVKMPYVRAEVGETSPGTDKSSRIYYDKEGNKMVRSEGSGS